jgi:hypothetical protein
MVQDGLEIIGQVALPLGWRRARRLRVLAVIEMDPGRQRREEALDHRPVLGAHVLGLEIGVEDCVEGRMLQDRIARKRRRDGIEAAERADDVERFEDVLLVQLARQIRLGARRTCRHGRRHLVVEEVEHRPNPSCVRPAIQSELMGRGNRDGR